MEELRCANCGKTAKEHNVLPGRGCAATGCKSFAWNAPSLEQIEQVEKFLKAHGIKTKT